MKPHLTVTYGLTGLHCGACVKKVSQALEPLAGSVEVSLSPMQVTLTDPAADESTIKKIVEAVGSYKLVSGSTIGQLPFNASSQAGWLQTYKPLLLSAAYILIASVLLQVGLVGMASLNAMETMRYFMAGFFLVFSFFKLLDLNAFADAYSGYDLLASRWRNWGLIYPFFELFLGLAYLSNFNPLFTNWVTLALMSFSALGVIKAVANKTQIQCACLGTVFKLPMSTVTIVEDVGMVLMALLMLAMI
jgi:copper chaperone CopZ